MTEAEAVIVRLKLRPHPEGGHHRELDRAPGRVPSTAHADGRSAYTRSYFLLGGENHFAWRGIMSNETWFFHAGYALILYMIDDDGEVRGHGSAQRSDRRNDQRSGLRAVSGNPSRAMNDTIVTAMR
jgi:predicted cupin superfamily sugar epimerase